MERRQVTIEITKDEVFAASDVSLEQEIAEILKNPELVARSFDDTYTPSKTVDLQSERIDELRKVRETLLKELHVAGAEKALENPALYLQEAVAGFAEQCRLRTKQYVHGGNDMTERFATVRHTKHEDGSEHTAKELEMAIQYERTAEEYSPRAYSVAAKFQHAMQEVPVDYVFYTNGDELTVTQGVWERGAWHYETIDDEIERFTLFQALVTDMLWAELNLDVKDNRVAAQLLDQSL